MIYRVSKKLIVILIMLVVLFAATNSNGENLDSKQIEEYKTRMEELDKQAKEAFHSGDKDRFNEIGLEQQRLINKYPEVKKQYVEIAQLVKKIKQIMAEADKKIKTGEFKAAIELLQKIDKILKDENIFSSALEMRRCDALMKIAGIYELYLQDFDKAIEYYNEVIANYPRFTMKLDIAKKRIDFIQNNSDYNQTPPAP